MKKIMLFGLFFAVFFSALAQQDTLPKVDERDKICLKEAFTIGKEYGKKMWSEWEKVPFALLLVEDEYEFLFNHPEPPKEFLKLGYDKYLKKEVFYRKKQLSSKVLSVAEIGGVPTVLIGKPEAIQKTSSEYVLTILGEHFLQMHYDRKDYKESIHSLGFSEDPNDDTWMLFYKFPYKDEKLNQQFELVCRSLWTALEGKEQKDFKNLQEKFISEREKFIKMLSEKDRKYFSFKTWRAGVSSYTEYRFAVLAAKKHKFSEEFTKLSDYTPFQTLSAKLYEELHAELDRMSLKSYRRMAFHALGAAESLLLDLVKPRWHKQYFEKKFFMEEYYK